MHGRPHIALMLVITIAAACDGGEPWRIHESDETLAVRFFDAAVLPGGDVYAVGEQAYEQVGAVVHYDGQEWIRLDFGGFIKTTTVWAADTDSVWVGGIDARDGTDQVLLRWNGSEWDGLDAAVVADGSSLEYVVDIWGTGARDVWLIAQPRESTLPHEIVYHWDGELWTEHTSIWASPLPEERTRKLIGGCSVAADDLWLVGSEWDYPGTTSVAFHWDGAGWRQHNLCACVVTDIACTADEVWVTSLDWEGDFSMIHRLEGDAWTEVYSTLDEYETESHSYFNGVWIADDGEVWVVGGRSEDPAITRRIEEGRIEKLETGETRPLHAVGGDASGRVWAFGDLGLVLEFTEFP